VHSIVFLATQHGGANLTNAFHNIYRVTGGLHRAGGSKYVHDLEEQILNCEITNEEFRHVSQVLDLDLASFYETRLTSVGVAKMVCIPPTFLATDSYFNLR
jgi:hypothetical protein